MVESVREVTCQGVEAYANTERGQWVLEWPGQIVLVVTAIYWTRAVEKALLASEEEPDALAIEADNNKRQLTDIISLVRGFGCAV